MANSAPVEDHQAAAAAAAAVVAAAAAGSVLEEADIQVSEVASL